MPESEFDRQRALLPYHWEEGGISYASCAPPYEEDLTDRPITHLLWSWSYTLHGILAAYRLAPPRKPRR